MKKPVEINTFLDHYSSFINSEVSGRFLSYDQLSPQLERMKGELDIFEIGRSFLNIPIESIKIGTGPVKILGWSQMHGNESTTTKSILDLCNLFIQHKNDPDVKLILERCTFLVIPMLNPDGAARYTRENVNKVDLNRDAHLRHEIESQVLRECFDDFQPDFCFNLHDQRTIFSAGNTSNPATVSFLTPAMDPARTVTESRLSSMRVIVSMNKILQQYLPGMVGRYDDAFNLNCTGDAFQSEEVPTILFEAGHFPGDYSREETRKYVALAIFSGLHSIATGEFRKLAAADYDQIPENKKNFFDIILRGALVKGEKVDIAIQYEEKVKSNHIEFEPVVRTMAPNISSFGHREIACEGMAVRSASGEDIDENDIVAVILLNDEKLSIKSQDIP